MEARDFEAMSWFWYLNFFGQVVDTRLLKAQVKAILGELKKFYCHVLKALARMDLDFSTFARGF